MNSIWLKIKTLVNKERQVIFTCVTLLILFGLLAVCSVSNVPNIFYRMLVGVVIGFFTLFAVSKFNKTQLVKFGGILSILGVVGLVFALVGPYIYYGRFVCLGYLCFEPAKILLPGFIILMAKLLESDNKRNLYLSVFITATVIAFIIGTPNMAMAILYLCVYLVILGYSRLPKQKMNKICLITGCTIIATSVVLALLSNGTPQFSEFWYAHKAVASSSFIGSNAESEHFLGLLPYSESEMILPAIVAKFGFIILIVLAGVYGLLISAMMKVANKAKDKFGLLVTSGVLTVFLLCLFSAVQFMYIGNAPYEYTLSATTLPFIVRLGLPILPFVSFGGTTLIMLCLMIGMVSASGSNK